jgi:multisubunit Na+/H+ antiporter MnhG subunit
MSRVAFVVAMILLAASVVVVWVCIVGLVRSRGPLDRLHFAGAASLLGPAGLAMAILMAGAPAASIVRGVLIAAILGAGGGLITHATARAEWLRTEGFRSEWQAGEGESHGAH